MKISTSKLRIGLVVGHNHKNQGTRFAIPPFTSEFSYNFMIANELSRRIFNDLNVACLFLTNKAEQSYRKNSEQTAWELKNADINFVLELHCNAFDGKTKILGSEVLFTDKILEPLTYTFQKILLDDLGISLHRNPKLITKNERGGMSLHSYQEQNIFGMILEPCFIDTINPESIELKENPQVYIESLLKFIKHIKFWYEKYYVINGI